MRRPEMADGRVPILYFSNSLARGGVEEYMLTLLRRLDRARFRLHLACTPTVASLLGREIPGDVQVLPVELRSPLHAGAAKTLARALRERRIAILHSHLFWSSLFASPIGWLCRVPVIVETPHVRELWRKGPVKGSYFIDRCVSRFVTRYIAVSEANAGYLASVKGIPARKIQTIYFGCDLARFDPERPAPPGMRAELGFGETDVVVVAIARLELQKGHAVLLEAMRMARQTVPQLRLVCVGEGCLRGELEERSAALGLRESVRFVGFRSNVADWLALADILALPSFYEGLPLIAIESLAAGRPVVATAVDGTPEVVLDGKYGLLASPGDAAALAKALRDLACDAGLRRRMGAAGRESVRKKFTEDRFIADMEEFYMREWREAKGGRDGFRCASRD